MSFDPGQALADRILGRQLASDALSLVECDMNNEERCKGFWREMLERCPERFKPKPEMLRVMTVDEAKAFELTTIPFGQYKPCDYANVPIDYLTWIADSAMELQAYLRSSIGRKRIEQNE